MRVIKPFYETDSGLTDQLGNTTSPDS